ncbi:hypothetical protein HDU93_006403 [Gonapodya sp. JEL0774]|nr:hypothetical protein HDU93_006403 [Gonapodya sp. JEL0774]
MSSGLAGGAMAAEFADTAFDGLDFGGILAANEYADDFEARERELNGGTDGTDVTQGSSCDMATSTKNPVAPSTRSRKRKVTFSVESNPATSAAPTEAGPASPKPGQPPNSLSSRKLSARDRNGDSYAGNSSETSSTQDSSNEEDESDGGDIDEFGVGPGKRKRGGGSGGLESGVIDDKADGKQRRKRRSYVKRDELDRLATKPKRKRITGTTPEEVHEKRVERRRERNRTAARRSRERRVKYIDELEAQVADLERDKQVLRNRVVQLERVAGKAAPPMTDEMRRMFGLG